MPMNSVGNQGTNPNLAIARDELHPGSALNPALFSQFGRNFHKNIGSLLPNAFCAIGEISFVEMLQQATVVQMQVIFGVGEVDRTDPGDGKQSRFSVREGELLGVQQGLVGSVRRYRPLQGLVTFQPLVVHPGKYRRQKGNFIHDLGWVPIMPVGTQLIGNVLDDRPVRAATGKRFEYLIEPLDAPLRAREGSLFLKAGRARKNHICVAASLAEENVLDDEKVEL